jgi:hypothetical protein
MTATNLYGLQRRGQWLTAPANPPTFGTEPIWAVPTLQQALEKAQLIKFTHGLSAEPRRIP